MDGETALADHTQDYGAVGPLSGVRRRILSWYDRNKRDLPWRRRREDGYAQWVAEVMLQQTRVETVEAYYERFLTKFPSIEALASAPHEQVLKHWEGLGYYRRALHLHEAAKVLTAERRPIPRSAAELRTLPGIGEYTAAAIASIAFEEPVAAVDGNVIRVVSRLFAVADDAGKLRGKRRVAELASALLCRRRPGDFNQALMDLGSRICTPREPNCPKCPLRRRCTAFQQGEPTSFPASAIKASVVELEVTAGLFISGSGILMRRRPTGGLWSGLWEPPAAVTSGDGGQIIAELAREESIVLDGKPRRIGDVRHQLTHRSVTFRVYACEVSADKSGSGRTARRWCSAKQLGRLAISTAHRKVLGLLDW